jgi:hypothetical protein
MTQFADEPSAGLLLSGGRGARWSYLMRAPEGLVVTNSLVGVCPVSRLDDEPLPVSPELATLEP